MEIVFIVIMSVPIVAVVTALLLLALFPLNKLG